MTENKNSRLTVIKNTSFEEKEKFEKTNNEYHSNPIYEKLVKFKLEQKRKRFTVEDLLKW